MDSPQLELIALNGSAEIGRWSLVPGVFTLGSSPECSIPLLGDGVGQEHARLRVEESGEVFLEPAQGAISIDGNSLREPARVLPEQYIDIGTISLLLESRSGSEEVSLGEQDGGGLPQEFRAGERYAVGEQIAKGGMGAVLQARQVAVRRTVAMKVILGDAGGDDRQRLRFIEEAQITGQLEHPNIVPIHDAGINAEGQLYYTMKLVKGITLKKILELLKKEEPGALRKYPLPVLLTIFNKVCDAVAFAHSRGVIHRDLKPENIMVGSYGEVLLMDWGLAKLIRDPAAPADGAPVPATFAREGESVVSARFEQGDAYATMDGSVIGTPTYMAPEQARGELAKLDARSDIFSLGIILYELLTLERPFKGKKAQEIMERIGRGDPPDPAPLQRTRKPAAGAPKLSHLPGGLVPESLAAVALKALAFQPEARYQSIKGIEADLAAYQNGFATGAEKAGAWKLVKLFVRRNRTVSIASVVILLLVLGFTGKLMVDRGRILAERNRAERGEDRANASLLELKKTAPVLRELADNEARLGHFDLGMAKLDAAIALDPEFLPSYWRRAWLLLGMSRLSDAAAAIRMAKDKDPAHSELSAVLPIVEQFAALPPSQPWPPENAAKLETLLRKVGAFGETIALSPKLELTARATAEIVSGRLKNWVGAAGINLVDGLISVQTNNPETESLEPLRGLPINILSISDCGQISDLSPLAGLPLRKLRMGNAKAIKDLTALRGAPLEEFEAYSVHVDFSPLRGSPLRSVNIGRTGCADLSFLTDSPVEFLDAQENPIRDLSPLRGKPLKQLHLQWGRGLEDLSPLRDMPIEELWLQGQDRLKDLTPLLDLPRLTKLRISDLGKALDPLRHHLSLQYICFTRASSPAPDEVYRPVAEFWKEYDAKKAAGKK